MKLLLFIVGLILCSGAFAANSTMNKACFGSISDCMSFTANLQQINTEDNMIVGRCEIDEDSAICPVYVKPTLSTKTQPAPTTPSSKSYKLNDLIFSGQFAQAMCNQVRTALSNMSTSQIHFSSEFCYSYSSYYRLENVSVTVKP